MSNTSTCLQTFYLSFPRGDTPPCCRMNYELYRRSAPGQALTDALDELIQNQQITPQLAMRVLFQFDRVMAESLVSMVRGRCTVKGHLSNYRYLDDVWTFIVKNAEVRFDDDTQTSKHLKIVACNARRTEAAAAGNKQ